MEYENEAIQELSELSDDPEDAHLEADRIILNLLRKNGGERVAKAWNEARRRIGFWYA